MKILTEEEYKFYYDVFIPAQLEAMEETKRKRNKK